MKVHGETPGDAEAHPVPDGSRAARRGRPGHRRLRRHRFQAAVLEIADELQQQAPLQTELEPERPSDRQVILGGGADRAHRVTSGHGLASADRAAGSGTA